MSRKFQPPQTLTPEECTAIFEEIFKNVSPEWYAYILENMPTVAQYLVESE